MSATRTIEVAVLEDRSWALEDILHLSCCSRGLNAAILYVQGPLFAWYFGPTRKHLCWTGAVERARRLGKQFRVEEGYWREHLSLSGTVALRSSAPPPNVIEEYQESLVDLRRSQWQHADTAKASSRTDGHSACLVFCSPYRESSQFTMEDYSATLFREGLRAVLGASEPPKHLVCQLMGTGRAGIPMHITAQALLSNLEETLFLADTEVSILLDVPYNYERLIEAWQTYISRPSSVQLKSIESAELLHYRRPLCHHSCLIL
jgi:hypothetical protein